MVVSTPDHWGILLAILLLIKIFDVFVNVFLEKYVPFLSIRESLSTCPITPGRQNICDKEIPLCPHVHEPFTFVPKRYPNIVEGLYFNLFFLKFVQNSFEKISYFAVLEIIHFLFYSWNFRRLWRLAVINLCAHNATVTNGMKISIKVL